MVLPFQLSNTSLDTQWSRRTILGKDRSIRISARRRRQGQKKTAGPLEHDKKETVIREMLHERPGLDGQKGAMI
jgi:hypothetical protein